MRGAEAAPSVCDTVVMTVKNKLDKAHDWPSVEGKKRRK